MTAPALPDFEHTLQLGRGDLDAAGLAESHGLLCGLICRQTSDSAADFLRQLGAMNLVIDPGEALHEALSNAWRTTLAQLDDEEFGFELWLPSDDEPLEDRAEALARWCSGFLAGLGSGGELDLLSEEAREAIGDLQEIARAELASPAAGDAADEEEEKAYAEIVEYVRVVALVLREDFRGPAPEEAIH